MPRARNARFLHFAGSAPDSGNKVRDLEFPVCETRNAKTKKHTMSERHFYADPELPFHVWVRASTNGIWRWVLRDAAMVRMAKEGADIPEGDTPTPVPSALR